MYSNLHCMMSNMTLFLCNCITPDYLPPLPTPPSFFFFWVIFWKFWLSCLLLVYFLSLWIFIILFILCLQFFCCSLFFHYHHSLMCKLRLSSRGIMVTEKTQMLLSAVFSYFTVEFQHFLVLQIAVKLVMIAI